MCLKKGVNNSESFTYKQCLSYEFYAIEYVYFIIFNAIILHFAIPQ